MEVKERRKSKGNREGIVRGLRGKLGRGRIVEFKGRGIFKMEEAISFIRGY